MNILWLLMIAGTASAAAKLGSYNINPAKISVSGLSAGAFMAVQMHITYSKTFMGVGVIAGGPYWCAKNSLTSALNDCMIFPSLINVGYLQQITRNTALTGFTNPTSYMQNDRVYLFSGTSDKTVVPGVVKATEEYYQDFIDPQNIKTEYSINCTHGFPTMNYGGECFKENNEYINKCGYDSAFEMIDHIHEGARKPIYGKVPDGKLLTFDQSEFFKGGIFQSYNGLDAEGYIFVPSQCSNGSTECQLHVSFHGCLQGKEFLNDIFARHTGYNEVAEANNMIVLYPQAKSWISNPKGCFDWWGYTGSSYASNIGEQTSIIYDMVQRISGL